MGERLMRALRGPVGPDRGDVLLSTVALVALAGIFTLVILSLAWGIHMNGKRNQRASIAQEAVDVALAEAMFRLNEDYGVVTDTGEYVSTDGAYNRTLPSENAPENADLTQFNATKQTELHEVNPDGTYGIQAYATWWVDVFDVPMDDGSGGDQNRVRLNNQIGDLYIAAEVATLDREIVYASRSIRVPLYQVQVREARAASQGQGLAYVASPLSLFQYAAFGAEGVEDTRDGSTLQALTPIASSGNITLLDPVTPFSSSDSLLRRWDSSMFLFGTGQCEVLNPSGTTSRCTEGRSFTTGFELVPDVQVIDNITEYCSVEGLEDFVASQQQVPMLLTGDVTYCFRDFIMDTDVRLVATGAGPQVARVFVERSFHVLDGARFVSASGSALGISPDSEPQVAIFTDSADVVLGGSLTQTTTKFYLYAPNADCAPGAIADDPLTGVDESDHPRSLRLYGSVVCRTVDLRDVDVIVNHPPLPQIVEFGSAGFGSDVYPNNLWFINYESIEQVARSDS